MYLFVYGTLKRGHGNHRVLGNSVYIRDALMHNHVMYSLGGFPGIVKGEGTVSGELFKVPDEQWDNLDGLEGYNKEKDVGMYLRRQWEVEIGSEPFMDHAWYYLWNGRTPTEDRLIKDGVWR